MNASMMILDEYEMAGIEGGNPLVLGGMALGAYMKTLDKIEENPNDYTWLMDWYYS